MKASTKTFVAFAILVGLIAGLYIFTNWFSKATGYVLGEEEKISLAQCLSGKGVILYVSSTCAACEKQAELFGDSAFSYINSRLCDNVDDCPALGGVPAWRINGQFFYGVQTLEDLLKISGCEFLEEG